jgi:hypothetical protein
MYRCIRATSCLFSLSFRERIGVRGEGLPPYSLSQTVSSCWFR